MLSKFLLAISMLLIFLSANFHRKAAIAWAIDMIDENTPNNFGDEKKLTRIGWITFILGGILGVISFNI